VIARCGSIHSSSPNCVVTVGCRRPRRISTLILAARPLQTIGSLAKIVTDREPPLGLSTSAAGALTGGPWQGLRPDRVDVQSEGVRDRKPGMPCRLPHGYTGPGHRWIRERAKGDADKVREGFRVPEHRGTTAGAEMLFDLSPRVAAAHVDLARPLGAHLLFREIGADAKGRASPALALRAMTHSQKRRLPGRLRAQRAAGG